MTGPPEFAPEGPSRGFLLGGTWLRPESWLCCSPVAVPPAPAPAPAPPAVPLVWVLLCCWGGACGGAAVCAGGTVGCWCWFCCCCWFLEGKNASLVWNYINRKCLSILDVLSQPAGRPMWDTKVAGMAGKWSSQGLQHPQRSTCWALNGTHSLKSIQWHSNPPTRHRHPTEDQRHIGNSSALIKTAPIVFRE